MSFLANTIKLIRPLNAIIVLATLLIVRIILANFFGILDLEPLVSPIDYSLMIIIGMAILGAGNVINDIIDQDIDLINKPHKVLIPAKITSKQAWYIYIILNIASLISSAYLAFKYSMPYYFFVPLFTVVLLFIYSKWLKKSLFFGNFVIAFLCACLPVVGFLVEDINMNIIMDRDLLIYHQIGYELACMISFSFILVMCRELVKDCQDVEGDLTAGANTIPIRYGISLSRQLMLFYILLYLIIFGIINYLRYDLVHSSTLIWATVLYILFVLITFFYLLNKYNGVPFFAKMSGLIKIYLILGLLFMLVK